MVFWIFYLAEEGGAKLFGHDVAQVRYDAHVGAHLLGRLGRHRRLWLSDVVLPEQELPVEVACVDDIEVNDFNVLEAREDQALQVPAGHGIQRFAPLGFGVSCLGY